MGCVRPYRHPRGVSTAIWRIRGARIAGGSSDSAPLHWATRRSPRRARNHFYVFSLTTTRRDCLTMGQGQSHQHGFQPHAYPSTSHASLLKDHGGALTTASTDHLESSTRPDRLQGMPEPYARKGLIGPLRARARGPGPSFAARAVAEERHRQRQRQQPTTAHGSMFVPGSTASVWIHEHERQAQAYASWGDQSVRAQQSNTHVEPAAPHRSGSTVHNERKTTTAGDTAHPAHAALQLQAPLSPATLSSIGSSASSPAQARSEYRVSAQPRHPSIVEVPEPDTRSSIDTLRATAEHDPLGPPTTKRQSDTQEDKQSDAASVAPDKADAEAEKGQPQGKSDTSPTSPTNPVSNLPKVVSMEPMDKTDTNVAHSTSQSAQSGEKALREEYHTPLPFNEYLQLRHEQPARLDVADQDAQSVLRTPSPRQRERASVTLDGVNESPYRSVRGRWTSHWEDARGLGIREDDSNDGDANDTPTSEQSHGRNEDGGAHQVVHTTQAAKSSVLGQPFEDSNALRVIKAEQEDEMRNQDHEPSLGSRDLSGMKRKPVPPHEFGPHLPQCPLASSNAKHRTSLFPSAASDAADSCDSNGNKRASSQSRLSVNTAELHSHVEQLRSGPTVHVVDRDGASDLFATPPMSNVTVAHERAEGKTADQSPVPKRARKLSLASLLRGKAWRNTDVAAPISNRSFSTPSTATTMATPSTTFSHPSSTNPSDYASPANTLESAGQGAASAPSASHSLYAAPRWPGESPVATPPSALDDRGTSIAHLKVSPSIGEGGSGGANELAKRSRRASLDSTRSLVRTSGEATALPHSRRSSSENRESIHIQPSVQTTAASAHANSSPWWKTAWPRRPSATEAAAPTGTDPSSGREVAAGGDSEEHPTASATAGDTAEEKSDATHEALHPHTTQDPVPDAVPFVYIGSSMLVPSSGAPPSNSSFTSLAPAPAPQPMPPPRPIRRNERKTESSSSRSSPQSVASPCFSSVEDIAYKPNYSANSEGLAPSLSERSSLPRSFTTTRTGKPGRLTPENPVRQSTETEARESLLSFDSISGSENDEMFPRRADDYDFMATMRSYRMELAHARAPAPSSSHAITAHLKPRQTVLSPVLETRTPNINSDVTVEEGAQQEQSQDHVRLGSGHSRSASGVSMGAAPDADANIRPMPAPSALAKPYIDLLTARRSDITKTEKALLDSETHVEGGTVANQAHKVVNAPSQPGELRDKADEMPVAGRPRSKSLPSPKAKPPKGPRPLPPVPYHSGLTRSMAPASLSSTYTNQGVQANLSVPEGNKGRESWMSADGPRDATVVANPVAGRLPAAHGVVQPLHHSIRRKRSESVPLSAAIQKTGKSPHGQQCDTVDVTESQDRNDSGPPTPVPEVAPFAESAMQASLAALQALENSQASQDDWRARCASERLLGYRTMQLNGGAHMLYDAWREIKHDDDSATDYSGARSRRRAVPYSRATREGSVSSTDGGKTRRHRQREQVLHTSGANSSNASQFAASSRLVGGPSEEPTSTHRGTSSRRRHREGRTRRSQEGKSSRAKNSAAPPPMPSKLQPELRVTPPGPVQNNATSLTVARQQDWDEMVVPALARRLEQEANTYRPQPDKLRSPLLENIPHTMDSLWSRSDLTTNTRGDPLITRSSSEVDTEHLTETQEPAEVINEKPVTLMPSGLPLAGPDESGKPSDRGQHDDQYRSVRSDSKRRNKKYISREEPDTTASTAVAGAAGAAGAPQEGVISHGQDRSVSAPMLQPPKSSRSRTSRRTASGSHGTRDRSGSGSNVRKGYGCDDIMAWQASLRIATLPALAET